MTINEIQHEIDRLYSSLTWLRGKDKDVKAGEIIAQINQLQAVHDAMVYAGVRDDEELGG